MLKSTAISIILILLIMGTAPAYWPVTVEENLPVAAEPDTAELNACALPLPSGKTLLVYSAGWYGHCYQIIDQYGELELPRYHLLTPDLPYIDIYGNIKIIPDGEGGAFIAWRYEDIPAPEGIYGQRIDSEGNLLWCGAGSRLIAYTEADFDISLDGTGGFLLSTKNQSSQSDVWAQRIDALGTPLWGDSGVVVCDEYMSQRYPKIAPDGSGGAYIIWSDAGPPYTYDALFMTHIDENGQGLWQDDGIFICEGPWAYQMDIISDGEGGAIVMSNQNGSQGNDIYRYDWNGNQLWFSDNASWNTNTTITEGEDGYFYLGFKYYLGGGIQGFFAQKMDMEGNKYWGGDTLVGAPLKISNMSDLALFDFKYKNDNFYGLFTFAITNSEFNKLLYVQKLNSEGFRQWGEDAVLLTYYRDDALSSYNICPDDSGGAVMIWLDWQGNYYDLWGKHVNADGSIGGPNASIEDVVMTIADNNAVLTWSAYADSANYYLRISDNPYSFPLEPDTAISDTVFVDVDAVLEGIKFYDIRWEPLE